MGEPNAGRVGYNRRRLTNNMLLQPFYGPLSGTTQVNQYQKQTFTHTYRDRQSFFICLLHLLWSVASSLFNLRVWDSFCTNSFQVLFGLLNGLAPSTTYCMCFFTQSLSSFCNMCPYQCNLFCCSTEIMLYNPHLSQLFTWNSGTLIFCVNVTHPSEHSHLCPLKCYLIFFSYMLGLTSMQYTTLHETAVQSPSHCHCKHWYQLPEFISFYSNSGLHSCIKISFHTQNVT